MELFFDFQLAIAMSCKRPNWFMENSPWADEWKLNAVPSNGHLALPNLITHSICWGIVMREFTIPS